MADCGKPYLARQTIGGERRRDVGELGPGTTGREKIEICSGFNVKISACLFLHLWQIDLRLPTNFFTVEMVEVMVLD